MLELPDLCRDKGANAGDRDRFGLDNFTLLEMAEGMEAQKGSRTVKAYRNREFLNSVSARSIRVQCELSEPKKRLEEKGVYNTIVFFGSARIREEGITSEQGQPTPAPPKEGIPTPNPSEEGNVNYYDAALRLAKELTEWSLKIENPKHRFFICSGGGPGIMEAANRGASEASGESIGLGISLPHEQSNNAYVSDDLSFEFHYFFIRKYWFLYHAKSFVIFPGGFGTLDEMFETLTLLQTGKIGKYMPIVLFGSEFWNSAVNFEFLRERGVISQKDLERFRIIDSVEEARDYIVGELTRIYL